jgi:hypothetical protein
VREHRQAFQDEVEPLFRSIVERATGRQVEAFLNQVNPDGVAAAIFTLAADADAG